MKTFRLLGMAIIVVFLNASFSSCNSCSSYSDEKKQTDIDIAHVGKNAYDKGWDNGNYDGENGFERRTSYNDGNNYNDDESQSVYKKKYEQGYDEGYENGKNVFLKNKSDEENSDEENSDEETNNNTIHVSHVESQQNIQQSEQIDYEAQQREKQAEEKLRASELLNAYNIGKTKGEYIGNYDGSNGLAYGTNADVSYSADDTELEMQFQKGFKEAYSMSYKAGRVFNYFGN
jgi:hypothetical protein